MIKSKKIMLNTGILYFRMIVTMFISLYISRIVINSLGLERFGLYSVLSSFVIMAGFITNILSVSSQRFMSESLSTYSDVKPREMFRACISVHVILSIAVLLIIEIIGSWFIYDILVQNVVSNSVVKFVFQTSTALFILNIIYSPFLSLLLAHENMSAYSWLTINDVILKLIAAFMISFHHGEVLIGYSINLLIVSSLSFIIGVCYCIIRYRDITLGILDGFILDKTVMSKLLSYIGWNLWGGLAAVVNNQGVNVLLNVFFGVTINAARAITTQIYSAINQVISSSQAAFNPQLVRSYIENDLAYIQMLICRGAKLSAILTLTVIVLLYYNVEYILGLWLGNYNELAVSFIRLMLIDVFINSVSGTGIMAIQASGKVKLYQSIVGGVLLFNLPISALLLWQGLSANCVYIVSIAISLVCIVLRGVFLQHYFKLRLWFFFKEVIIRAFLASIVGYYLSMLVFISNTSAMNFFFNILIEGVICLLSSFIIILNLDEKKYIVKCCSKLIFK